MADIELNRNLAQQFHYFVLLIEIPQGCGSLEQVNFQNLVLSFWWLAMN